MRPVGEFGGEIRRAIVNRTVEIWLSKSQDFNQGMAIGTFALLIGILGLALLFMRQQNNRRILQAHEGHDHGTVF